MRVFTKTPGDLAEAADLLRSSKLVIFPTETFYALGALALDEAALAAVFALKGRDLSQPVALLCASAEQAFSLWEEVPPLAARLAARYWPGPLTLVLPGRADLPRALTSPYGVGARVSPHPTARALSGLVGPLVATSANRAKEPPLLRAKDALSTLSGAAAIVADDEGVLGGLPSTIAAVRGDEIVVLRPGPISPRATESE